jgi:hypothetical protein
MYNAWSNRTGVNENGELAANSGSDFQMARDLSNVIAPSLPRDFFLRAVACLLYPLWVEVVEKRF